MKKWNLQFYRHKNSEGLTSIDICQLDFNSEPSVSALNINVESKFQIIRNPEYPFSVMKSDNRIITD
jgi:hypothetical protein